MQNAIDVSDEQIVVGEGVALDVRPAGFLLRAASSLIDAVVSMLGFGALLLAAAWIMSSAEQAGATIELAAVQAVIIALLVVAWVLAPCLVETLSGGRSLGRLALGLRIVRDDGGAAGFRHALIRALLGVLEFLLTAGGLAIVVGLVHPRAKRLGDLLAGTVSQNERAPKLLAQPVPLPPGLERWAQLADVARLPDRLARRMRDFLTQAPRLEPAARLRQAGEVAREVRYFVHPIPDVDAETFLRAVAAVRFWRESSAHELGRARLAHVDAVLQALPHRFPPRG